MAEFSLQARSHDTGLVIQSLSRSSSNPSRSAYSASRLLRSRLLDLTRPGGTLELRGRRGPIGVDEVTCTNGRHGVEALVDGGVSPKGPPYCGACGRPVGAPLPYGAAGAGRGRDGWTAGADGFSCCIGCACTKFPNNEPICGPCGGIANDRGSMMPTQQTKSNQITNNCSLFLCYVLTPRAEATTSVASMLEPPQ